MYIYNDLSYFYVYVLFHLFVAINDFIYAWNETYKIKIKIKSLKFIGSADTGVYFQLSIIIMNRHIPNNSNREKNNTYKIRLIQSNRSVSVWDWVTWFERGIWINFKIEGGGGEDYANVNNLRINHFVISDCWIKILKSYLYICVCV